MHCILRARTHDEDVDRRVEFAILEVTGDLIRRIEDYAGQLATMSLSPAFLEFWDWTPTFLDWPSLHDEELYEEMEQILLDQVGDRYGFFPELPQALRDWVEKNEITVDTVRTSFPGGSPGECCWEGFLKHTGIAFSTALVRTDDLKRAFVEHGHSLPAVSGIQLKL